MLSVMRDGKYRWFFYGLLALLAVGLIGFGSGGLGGGTIRSIGKVGDHPISVASYANTMQNSIRQVQSQMGRTVTPAELQQLGVQSSVMRNLVSQAALMDEANQKGISLGDDIVARELRGMRQFQGIDGEFDSDIYRRALTQSGSTATETENEIRSSLASSLLQASVTGGVKTDGAIADTLMRFANEQRNFEWAILENNALAEPIPAPTTAQIQQQYEDNPTAYTSLRTNKITYVSLTPEMLESSINVTDQQIKEKYDAEKTRFNTPERRAVERLVFPDADTAQDARTRFDAGSVTFDELVNERGLELRDINLGDVTNSSLDPGEAAAVFSAGDLGVVGPIDTSLGPALFRINAILAAESIELADAKDELKAELATEAARRNLTAMVDDLDDALAGGSSLEDLAETTEMELGKIDLTVDSSEDIAAYEAFRQKAASTKKGDFPTIEVLSDGGIFALRVDDIVDPAVRPLEDVQSQVTEDWKAAEATRRLTAQAEIIKGQLENGEAFQDLGLSATQETELTRERFVEGLPLNFVLDVFNLDKGDVLIQDSENGVAIGRVNEIIAFDTLADTNKDRRDQVVNSISNRLSSDLLDSFSSALQARTEVELNDQVITQINGQLTGQYSGANQ